MNHKEFALKIIALTVFILLMFISFTPSINAINKKSQDNILTPFEEIRLISTEDFIFKKSYHNILISQAFSYRDY